MRLISRGRNGGPEHPTVYASHPGSSPITPTCQGEEHGFAGPTLWGQSPALPPGAPWLQARVPPAPFGGASEAEAEPGLVPGRSG